MNLHQENDRAHFEEFCESSRKNGRSLAFLYVEGLNSKNLTKEERIRRVSFKSKDVMNQLVALNRPDYVLHWNFADKIFELFQSLGYLSNAEELEKLRKVIILSVIFIKLNTILENAELAGNPEEHMKNDPESGTGPLSPKEIELKQVLSKINNQVNLVWDPSTIDDLTRILACHNWSALKGRVNFKCKTNEIKCLLDCGKLFNPDLTYANLGRSGLLISRKGKLITAHSLSTTSYEKLKTRSFIENMMAQCRKKH